MTIGMVASAQEQKAITTYSYSGKTGKKTSWALASGIPALGVGIVTTAYGCVTMNKYPAFYNEYPASMRKWYGNTHFGQGMALSITGAALIATGVTLVSYGAYSKKHFVITDRCPTKLRFRGETIAGPILIGSGIVTLCFGQMAARQTITTHTDAQANVIHEERFAHDAGIVTSIVGAAGIITGMVMTVDGMRNKMYYKTNKAVLSFYPTGLGAGICMNF